MTEDELIDDEIKRGASVDDLTNRVFWNRHPELRDCRLPRSCQELERLQREWALIRAKVATKKDQGGRKKSPKPYGLGQGLATWPTLLAEYSGFRSAEDRIYEDGFEAVLAVLAGASRWQEYIRENLRVARQNLPRRPFRIVSGKEFAQTMQALGGGGDIAHIPGVTDKRTGVITMQEFFGVNSRATYLGAALHEAVHLVSHPAGRGRTLHSTAFSILGEGLLEGLVECVTREILSAQGIALARPGMLGHQRRVPVARELLRTFSAPLFARVLFAGDFQQFLTLMNHVYSPAGWAEIGRLTTANNPDRAIQRMNELSAAEERRRNEELKRRFNQIQRRTPP